MPSSIQIIAEKGLAHFRYEGLATASDGFAAFREYLANPERKPGQHLLVDLSAVSGVEDDFGARFRAEATKVAALITEEYPILMVYLAPTQATQRIARQIMRGWDGLDCAVVRIAEDWDGAMDILGLRRDALDGIVAP